MKRLILPLALATLIVLASVGLLFFVLSTHVHSPFAAGEHRLTVGRGASLRSVLRELARDGVVEKPDWIYYYARLHDLTNIRSGDYALPDGSTPHDLLVVLTEGQVVTESFIIPEGFNRWQIRDQLAKAGWVDSKSFDALCDDKKFLEKNRIPGPSCEGYLFPETYTFARGVAPETLFETLFAAWRKNVDAVRERLGNGPLGLDPREFTTLASIVEKETGAPEERPRIACVFYNRLQSKPMMKLQTDPTVIYAATLSDPNFDGNLKSYHLRQLDNPYNTYLKVGLPPGPIAAPGRAAFEAVAKPVSCQDLFFVSMNNGKHVFCPTYECHLKNVQKWQVDYFRRRPR